MTTERVRAKLRKGSGMSEAAGSGEASGRAGKNIVETEKRLPRPTGGLRASVIAGRRKVIAALLVAMMVTAMEQLVVSPAMPTIIAQLKGFEIYPWVISAYLLAATVSTPIYGKLADLFGRKRVLLFGLALFSAGSMLSGTAQSMGQLIAMRTIQGLGAGAVSPIVLTLLGDLFTLEERAHPGPLQRRLGSIQYLRSAHRRLADGEPEPALGLLVMCPVRGHRFPHGDLLLP